MTCLSKPSCRVTRSQPQGSARHLEVDVHGAPWLCRCPAAQPCPLLKLLRDGCACVPSPSVQYQNVDASLSKCTTEFPL